MGIVIYDDYGISWDEGVHRADIGYVNYNAIFYGEKEDLQQWADKYHGPVFDLLLIFAEKIFHLTDSREIFLLRHLLTFLILFTGIVFFYRLLLLQFNSWKYALMGCFMLVLSPRIFAESFYNPKDIPFLSLFIISVYFLFRYRKEQNYRNAFLFALVSGMLIDLRIMGILILAIGLFLSAHSILTSIILRQKINFKWKPFVLFFALLYGFIVLFWPILWIDPLSHFIGAFTEMSRYPWDNYVFYCGKYIQGSQIPWHYLPVWISITTPLPYLVFFGIGMLSFAKKFLKMPQIFLLENRENIVFIFWFFIPLLAIIGLKSVVYDSWRHVFYIYPAFVCIALWGISDMNAFFKKIKFLKSYYKIVVGIVVFTGFIPPAFFMIKNHPYQNIYFNAFISNPQEKFDMDYWGLSYREGLEYILHKDTNQKINIAAANLPGELNFQILPERERKRLRYTENAEFADYYIDNFRWGGKPIPFSKEIHSVFADGIKILSVYSLPDTVYITKSITKKFTDFEKQEEIWGGYNIFFPESGAVSGSGVCRLDSLREYSATLRIPGDSQIWNAETIFIRASFWKYDFNSNSKALFVVSVDLPENKNLFWRGLPLNTEYDKALRIWKKSEYEIRLPEKISANEKVSVYIWNLDKNKFYIDDFEVEIFDVRKNFEAFNE